MHSLHTAPEVSGSNAELSELRARLLRHPLYDSVRSVEALRLFMREHAFAVWDFMSLLKRLQQTVSCCTVPWFPSAEPDLARFINEIVLGEESDEDGHGGYCSHFELYLAAMDEVGADTKPILTFLEQFQQGIPLENALASAPILPSTRQFVHETIQLASSGKPHEVAAAFFHGREDVIPDMFARLVESSSLVGVRVDRMVHYLKRHIEVDANDHGPLARKLVDQLCGGHVARKHEATAAAVRAIGQRIALWDGLSAAIQQLYSR